jgi:predicted glycogen debranching enzyme
VATAADGGEVLRALWPALTSIVAHHLSGTLSGIGVDGTDGLLCAGGPDTQLTWMDARVDGQAVTPRCGKPVEINALWYSALCFLAEQAEQAGADGTIYARLAERARSSFPEVFGRGDGLGLWDVIAPDGTPDPAIRPNQIIAAALVNSPLCADQRREVVDVVERELLTPFGLRTLARSDPSYRGRYAGTPSQRDSAYHQGTVWPWLLGPFVDAHLAVHGDCARARSFLIPFRAHLLDAGVGFISEVFDGDPPHTPGGCIAQAWSVAEVLRAWRSTLPR